MKKIITSITIVLLIIGGVFVFTNVFTKNKEQKDTKDTLILNTEKTEYLLGETVRVQMAAIDSNGQSICQGNFKFTINNEEIDKVSKSPNCGNSNFNTADYSINYKPERTGKYVITFTNNDIKEYIKSSFDVVNETSIVIKRDTPTIISPQKRYPVKLTVTTKKPFEGKVSDTIPDGLKVLWFGSAKIEGNKISWQVSLKAGETKDLIYEYSAPDMTPATYIFKDHGGWTVVAAKNTEEPVKVPEIINKYK